ncbi:TonB-dependent siderophore receptor [Stutzerimonas kirkiae]|uniref:TonB-dependent siderophore receptor n=1 Tax=Stutzerimonas kirkiae TaxID=2211392 RepID=A0A4Q9R7E5_9GAMM|nr:TonB-dependent receptor [Stutzerimonas kirkiae]TBU96527.1 TonB-dependent siderophore receptor [Stutzerimonas kirkiae]TBV02190.1 TonB-dependent siderophore receptor [Stutzerimonas kirkiae]TBV15695.1 TonB-dependent siderophore receptor [Stutzerimonas kirkiae]
MSTRTSLPLRPLALAITLACGGLLHSPGGFADNQRHYAIAAGTLTAQLAQFAEQAGIVLVGNAALTDGRSGPGLSGDYAADAGLEALLRGHGLSAQRQADGSYVLAAANSLELNSTYIESSRRNAYQPPANAAITRGSASALEVPQTINVVPEQVLRDQQPRNLDDALNNVSGITQANTLGSTQDAVLKRGFGDNRDGSIMRDGLPSVLGRNLGASAERVEVLKGPASLLYGIQDPGGVVNVVSKKPQLQQRNEITVRTSAYAHGKQGAGGTLDSTGALADSGLAYRLILDHDDNEYWREFGQYRQTLVAPSLAWYGERTTASLSYEHREFETPFDRGTALNPTTMKPLDIPYTRRLDDTLNITEGRSDLWRFAVEHQLDDAWKANFAYGWSRETYDDNQARVTAVNTDTGRVTRRIDGTHGAISSDSFATASLLGDVEFGGFRHELVLGIDSEKRKIYRADLIRGGNNLLDYNDPLYGTAQPSSVADPGASDQTDLLRTDSIFLQDSWHLNERWILVAGGRYMIYDQYAGRGRPFDVNTNLNGQTWVPRAGVVYKISEQASLYASYSESFKPNSSIAPLAGISVVDASIAPEEGKSWEIGGKLAMAERFTATLALFDIEKRNVMVTDTDSNGDTFRRAAGKVDSRGLELDISGQLGERWSLIGSYAWLDAQVSKDPQYKGNPVQNVAKNVASLSLVYDAGPVLGGDGLRLGSGARYVGKRAGDAADSFELPSYTVADAFIAYDTRIGAHDLGLQLNVKNLFDRQYYPSAVNQYYVAVGDPRQIQLSATLGF